MFSEVIKSKADLMKFTDEDLMVRGLKKAPLFYRFRKPLLYFMIMLRKAEYYENTKHGLFSSIMANYMKLRVKRIGMHMGLTVPLNACGPGLDIAHWGSIVISAHTKIGKNCKIHSCVNIGESEVGAPRIGDNVYIGPGAKLFGAIEIGDNVTIGANAVVNKSFPSNVVIAGIPAKVIKEKDV